MLLSMVAYLHAILRCKESEQYQFPANLLNPGLRSHDFRTRDDDH